MIDGAAAAHAPAGQPLRLRAGLLLRGPTAGSSASRWTASAASWAASWPGSIPRPAPTCVFTVPDAPTRWRSASPRSPASSSSTALIRNHYVGRTFINPTQAVRVAKVKIKFNPVRDVIEGRSVVMVDDSLVRGTTSGGWCR